jgi:GR25 family glycosyltransferase involved in LPS biosynthesis
MDTALSCASFNLKNQNDRILIVEDDCTLEPIFRRMIKKISPNIEVDWATSGESALRLLTENKASNRNHNELALMPLRPYRMVLADVFVRGPMSGLDLAQECSRVGVSSPFVLTSQAMAKTDDYAFLPKPVLFEDLKTHLENHLQDDFVIKGIVEVLIRAAPRFKPAFQISSAQRNQMFEWFLTVVMIAIFTWTQALSGKIPLSSVAFPDPNTKSLEHLKLAPDLNSNRYWAREAFLWLE